MWWDGGMGDLLCVIFRQVHCLELDGLENKRDSGSS